MPIGRAIADYSSNRSGYQPPHLYPTGTTEFHFRNKVAGELLAKQIVCCIRNPDFIGVGGRLDTCGEIDRVSPKIIGKTLPPNDTRNDWA